MKRPVIIAAAEPQYQGLHGMNNVLVLELEQNEYHIASEYGVEMSEEVAGSYSYLIDDDDDDDVEFEHLYYIWRLLDDSKLTLQDVEQMVDDYGYDVSEHEDFDGNFYDWSE